MSIDQMRDTLVTLYKGEKWKNRVYRMSEKQVYAIYMRKTEEGRRLRNEYNKQ